MEQNGLCYRELSVYSVTLSDLIRKHKTKSFFEFIPTVIKQQESETVKTSFLY